MILGMLLWFTASFGYQYNTVTYSANEFSYTHQPIYAELEVHAENDWLDVYGKYKNEMRKGDFWLVPRQDDFIVGAKLSSGSVSLNVEHQCLHTVASKEWAVYGEYGGYNKIWIEVSSK
jgi:hypothetical protein